MYSSIFFVSKKSPHPQTTTEIWGAEMEMGASAVDRAAHRSAHREQDDNPIQQYAKRRGMEHHQERDLNMYV